MNSFLIPFILIVVFSLILLPFLFVRVMNFSVLQSPSRQKSAGMSFVMILLVFISGVAFALTASSVFQTDYSSPFNYGRTRLENSDSNLTRSTELHEMMIDTGFRDPQGFLFNDLPKSDGYTRSISLEPSDPYYLLNYDGNSIESLLMVPTDWLVDYGSLETKFRQFIQVPAENQSIVDFVITQRSDVFGSFVDVQIRVYDPASDDMVLVIFGYDPETGFADVNIVYTTIEYSYESPSTIYFEVAYSATLNAVTEIFSFLLPVISISLLFVIPLSMIGLSEDSFLYRFLYPTKKTDDMDWEEYYRRSQESFRGSRPEDK